jgi:hypothetical protein
MKKFSPHVFFILATIFLTFSFYRDGFGVVEKNFYETWQTNFDRTVVARLVENRQNGFLSAGGLLGLGDVEAWDFLNSTNKHQYNVYLSGGKFKTYLGYTSTPGFQGVFFGIPDQILGFSKNINLKIFRGSTTLGSAIALAFICTWLAIEFGSLAGILVVLCVGFSEVLIRSGSSIYWNLWAFYLPLIAGTLWLSSSAKKGKYLATLLYATMYTLCLLKVLMNGFEGITTTMVMATVPLIYFAVLEKWNWKVLLERFLKLGLVLCAAVITGVVILAIQIALYKGGFSASTFYIMNALNRRATGNPDQYSGIMADSMRASIFDVIGTYLRLGYGDFRIFNQTWHIPFWGLFLLFAVFTIVFIRQNNSISDSNRKGWALVLATWYSFLAPISWFIVFKPDAYFHTSIYKMLWYMPFVLLGLSICGLVITDLFKRNPKLN